MQPLPPPKQRKPRARPEELAAKVADAAGLSTKKRPLPEEPDELEKALRIYMLIAAPIVNGLGKLNTVFRMDDWDKTETDAGKMAIAAMIYENGGKLSGEILVVMWLLGVYPPRVMKRLSEDKKPKVLQASSRVEEKTLTAVT